MRGGRGKGRDKGDVMVSGRKDDNAGKAIYVAV